MITPCGVLEGNKASVHCGGTYCTVGKDNVKRVDGVFAILALLGSGGRPGVVTSHPAWSGPASRESFADRPSDAFCDSGVAMGDVSSVSSTS